MKKHRYTPALETLERRDTPAGTVTGSFHNGTWTLVGDADANLIRINPGASHDAFVVTGQGGTTVAGVTDPSNVQNIVIKLGEGNDSVEINDTGSDVRLRGHLKILGGHGNNGVAIARLGIGKSLSVLNGSGFDYAILKDSVVHGQAVFHNGSGGSQTVFERNSTFSAIGSNLVVRNGSGTDYILVMDTNIGGNVNVDNGLPDANAEAGGVQFFNNNNHAARSIIRGNISVRYQGGTTDSDAVIDTEVLGNVKFNYGNGIGQVFFDGFTVPQPVHIHGNLTVASQGATIVHIGSMEERGLIVDGNLTIGGGANDLITVYRLQVGGATRIRTGGGADVIYIDDSTFAGPTQIQTGAGVDNVHLERRDTTSFGTQFAGDLKLDLGADDDELLTAVFGDPTRVVELLGKGYLSGGGGNNTWYGAEFVAPFYPVDMVFFET